MRQTSHLPKLLSGEVRIASTACLFIASQRLDQRLATALLGHGTVVLGTHQALADELGTVHEKIITRLLHRFRRAGWLHTGRECIEIVDAAPPSAPGDGSTWPSC